jgi:hypothetical protein
VIEVRVPARYRPLAEYYLRQLQRAVDADDYPECFQAADGPDLVVRIAPAPASPHSIRIAS